MTDREKAEKLVRAAPALTDKELSEINAVYPAYLFRIRRKREIWTSCCDRHEIIPTEEITDVTRAVLEAPHHPEPKLYPMCHCGYMSAPAPARPELVPCPFCGRPAKVKELGRTGKRDNLTAYRRVVVLRWYRKALWAMAYLTNKRYGGEWALTEKPDITLHKVYRFVPGKTSRADRGYWNGTWSGFQAMDRMPKKLPLPIGEPFHWGEEQGMGYDVIGAEEIEKSPFRWCGFGQFLKVSTSAMKFLALCSLYPRQVEMLMKAGLVDAVEDLVDRNKWNARAFDWRETDPRKAFGLSKEELKKFLAGKKDLYVLEKYKLFKRAGIKCSIEELYDLSDVLNRTLFHRVTTKLKTCGLTPETWRQYIEKAQKEDQGRKKKPLPLHNIITWWSDYIYAAEVLGLDLKNPIVLMPKDLKKKHDEVTATAAAIAEARRKDADKEKERAMLRKLTARYTYSDGRWLIRPPVGPNEIKVEGIALRHCVGGYADRHMRGVLTILFLRDRRHPHKPLVTIEMDGDRLVQIHGWEDERTKCKENPTREDPRKLYAEFLEPWLAWVAAGSKRDKQGRPKLPESNQKEVQVA